MKQSQSHSFKYTCVQALLAVVLLLGTVSFSGTSPFSQKNETAGQTAWVLRATACEIKGLLYPAHQAKRATQISSAWLSIHPLNMADLYSQRVAVNLKCHSAKNLTGVSILIFNRPKIISQNDDCEPSILG